jgi:hypothetical protein
MQGGQKKVGRAHLSFHYLFGADLISGLPIPPELPRALRHQCESGVTGAVFARITDLCAVLGCDADCAATGAARTAMPSAIRTAIRLTSIVDLSASQTLAYPFTVQSLTEPFSHLRVEARKSMTERFGHDLVR